MTSYLLLTCTYLLLYFLYLNILCMYFLCLNILYSDYILVPRIVLSPPFATLSPPLTPFLAFSFPFSFFFPLPFSFPVSFPSSHSFSIQNNPLCMLPPPFNAISTAVYPLDYYAKWKLWHKSDDEMPSICGTTSDRVIG